MPSRTTLLLLTILSAFCLAACSSSDSNNDSDEPSGVLSVYGEGSEGTPGMAADYAPPELCGVRECHVTFTLLKLRKTDGSTVTLINDESGSGTIDLVAAAWNPTLVATLSIPEGDYDGITVGRISVIEITDDQGETCTVMDDDTYDFGPVLMKGSITVDDSGNVGVDVDVPIISGECDPVSGVGTISFAAVGMRPHSEE